MFPVIQSYLLVENKLNQLDLFKLLKFTKMIKQFNKWLQFPFSTIHPPYDQGNFSHTVNQFFPFYYAQG